MKTHRFMVFTICLSLSFLLAAVVQIVMILLLKMRLMG